MGDHRRTLIVATGHELHCLYRLVNALNIHTLPTSHHAHSLHCLDYIRQGILCDADLTLEPFDPLELVASKGKLGAVHVCKDWTKLLKSMEENFEGWADFYSKVKD